MRWCLAAVAAATLLVTGCGRTVERTVDEAEATYRPVLRELQQAVSDQVPEIVWRADAPARPWRGASACTIRLEAWGDGPGGLVRHDDAMREAVTAVYAAHGFDRVTRYGDDPGGGATLHTQDPTGTRIRYRSKGDVTITVSVPAAPATCG